MAVFTLKLAPPFRLDLTVWVLRRVPINQMDRWDGQTYRRILVLGETAVEVEVVQRGTAQSPELLVTTRGGRMTSTRLTDLKAILEKILGLNIDLRPFYQLAKHDPRLAELIEPFVGFRPPRLASVFETLLNGVACQQVSLIAGMHLLNHLCREYGLAIGENHAVPRPVDLASARREQLRGLGFSNRKAQTILDIARSIVEGRLDLEGLSALTDAEALDRLLELKGIGRWTAQYILLRGLGRLDVFPADDVGSQKKMQQWLKRRDTPDYDGMYRIIAPWRPYRGLIYFSLLLNHQCRVGLIKPTAASASQQLSRRRDPCPTTLT